jgi:hypothetical protein
MALRNYKTHELHGELLRRGHTFRRERCNQIVALSRLIQFTENLPKFLPGIGDALQKTRLLLGDQFDTELVDQAEYYLKEHAE